MKTKAGILFMGLLISGLIIPPVLADPPPWAPAHGYRNKHKDKERGDRDYYETEYQYYGVLDGRCNREEIGTVLGGAVGGVVGRNAADDKTMGTIAGVIVGAVVGNVIGRSMDDADRYCTGHVLEYAEDNRMVSWDLAERNIHYRVTPTRTFHRGIRYCRDFIVVRETPRRTTTERQRACRNDNGAWNIIRKY
jgi:surface antigen